MVTPMLPPESTRGSEAPRPYAVILGIQLPDVSNEEFEASLGELERLGTTLGLQIIGRVSQKRASLAGAAVVGAGKLKQLATFTGGSGVVPAYAPPGKQQPDARTRAEQAAQADDDEEADAAGEPTAGDEKRRASVVLVDCDLTPGQARNLERATGAEVLDRSMVIVSIFQRHARTREAKLQVEIAQLSYMAPRLREANAGADRQRGGIGGKGAGESALELDRRRIRDRIAELREKLEIVKRESDARRSRRVGAETNTVALVGYTNAGKSSLMRALTGDPVYVADQLFATLDTTVRAMVPPTQPRILVSDTVGFIKKLPHDLVASFRSTLEEARDADLLLHVVDGSDPALRSQHEVTATVLEEIGAGEKPTLLLINKADRLSAEQQQALAEEFPKAIIMSVRRPQDVESLHNRIVEFFEAQMDEAEFLVPYAQQRHVAMLHERCRVLQESYEDEGVRVRVRAPAAMLGSLRRQLQAAGDLSDSSP
jgi:GTPase